ESFPLGSLRPRVASVGPRLHALGEEPGDRVVGYLPNCVEGVVAFVAAAAVGACWSQTALDYSPRAAADRLAQLTPKVLFAGGGYAFKGEVRDRRQEVEELRGLLPGVSHTIAVPTSGLSIDVDADDVCAWSEVLSVVGEPGVRAVAFDHPLWV